MKGELKGAGTRGKEENAKFDGENESNETSREMRTEEGMRGGGWSMEDWSSPRQQRVGKE